MDIQTASSVGSIFASPTAGNVALMSIPVLFGALLWTFRQHHLKLTQQYHDSLDLIAEQNKQVIDLKATVKDLESAQQRNRDRSIDLKEQIDHLYEELEKTREEIATMSRFGQYDEYDDQYNQVSAVQNEGISDLLRSLEGRTEAPAPVPKPAEPEPNPSMTQIQKQAEFYAQHAEAAYKKAQQARRQEPPMKPQPEHKPQAEPAPSPDMTQSLFAQVKPSDTQFDLQDYL